MSGFDLSTSIGDAIPITTNAAAVVPLNMTAGKSLMMLIQAATGNQFWFRQAATVGALPARAAVVATPADLVAVTGNVQLFDIARVLDAVVGIYSDAAVGVIGFVYNHPSTTPELGSVLTKTIVDKLKRVA